MISYLRFPKRVGHDPSASRNFLDTRRGGRPVPPPTTGQISCGRRAAAPGRGGSVPGGQPPGRLIRRSIWCSPGMHNLATSAQHRRALSHHRPAAEVRPPSAA